MLRSSDKEAIDRGMILTWVIWTALFLSLFVYVLVCHLVGDKIRQNANPDFPLDLFRNILYFIAIIELIISYFLRKAALAVRSSDTSPRKSIISQTSTQSAFIGKYAVAMIITLALSESIGIYGMVLFFLGDSFNTLYTFIGVAAIAMFFYRPKKEEIMMLANDMKMNISQS